jgi:S1-C subfamily serine protease
MTKIKTLWIISFVSIFLLVISSLVGVHHLEKRIDNESPPSVTTQFPDTIQRVLPSVVHIMCSEWQGSGVALTEDIVATARHVVDGTRYEITTNDGRIFEGTQAISHKDYDIGFIKIKPLGKLANKLGISSKLTPAKFGSIKDCILGQPVFIIGSPHGKINFNNVTLGIISGLNRDWDSLSRHGELYGWKIAFASDSAAHPGNSGGAVFSMDGVVRGLLVGAFSPVLNCSMPSDLFLDDIENIKMIFAFDKYKVEQERQPYSYSVESREDYYIWD